ncbi:hypothetical protein T08_392 [Trichinella sp. T8]|nr:hypothetical protein T08_392 [Trichinella sp. T8]
MKLLEVSLDKYNQMNLVHLLFSFGYECESRSSSTNSRNGYTYPVKIDHINILDIHKSDSKNHLLHFIASGGQQQSNLRGTFFTSFSEALIQYRNPPSFTVGSSNSELGTHNLPTAPQFFMNTHNMGTYVVVQGSAVRLTHGTQFVKQDVGRICLNRIQRDFYCHVSIFALVKKNSSDHI